tara:strand:- start:937 stop:1119 length:183 start_codon:yes stop_codon:yes gene_type:complete
LLQGFLIVNWIILHEKIIKQKMKKINELLIYFRNMKIYHQNIKVIIKILIGFRIDELKMH